MRRIRGIAVVVLVLAWGCGGSDRVGTGASDAIEPTVSTVTPVPTRAEAERLTLDLVDPSRPTPSGAGLPHADERRLVTDVYVPAGTGPFPFIAFSHGLNGHPRKFTQLLGQWADAGYAVAAPTFPLSNDEVPGVSTFADLPSQPGDVSFVIDQLLAMSEDENDPLYGVVDPDHIGVAGLSLGGATTYGVAFNDCCLDERPVAAMVLDGARLAVGGAFHMGSGLPLLIMHADEDFALPYAEAADAYVDAIAPKYLVTLHEFAHASPYENDPDPADELVTASTIAFWDRYLRDDESAEQRIVDAITPSSLATLESETG
jgi:dienelactone hydrolase